MATARATEHATHARKLAALLAFGCVLGALGAPNAGCRSSDCFFLYDHHTCAEWPGDRDLCPFDGCKLGSTCVDACAGLDQASCQSRAGCRWIAWCIATSDVCAKTSVAACPENPACMLAPICVGQAFDCESVDSHASCQAHPHCAWEHEEDPFATRY
jgi:hypothetical protein